MSDPIPEIEQAEALKKIAMLGEQRQRLLAELDTVTERLRPLVITAVQAGADRTRVAELAKLSRNGMYAWLREAGVALGPPRGRTGGQRRGPKS